MSEFVEEDWKLKPQVVVKLRSENTNMLVSQHPHATICTCCRGHGRARPACCTCVAGKDEQHIRLFLVDVQKWHQPLWCQLYAGHLWRHGHTSWGWQCRSRGHLRSTIITDKDFAEISSVKAVCPTAHIFLCHFHFPVSEMTYTVSSSTLNPSMPCCHFHIMKAFVEEINRQNVVDGEILLNVRSLRYFITN